jgi:hypothetical protein
LTLLNLIQQAARRIGITPPSVVVASTDANVQELLTCAQEEGFQLMRRGTWQVLRKQQIFKALAQEEQTGMIPADFDRFVQETFWNRTKKRIMWGPVTPQEWQNLKAWTATPAMDTFIIRGGNVLITPNPTAGDDLAFEYVSKNWCQSAGGDGQDEWLADTDTGILDERLMRLGVVWRYKQKKGLNWQVDFQNYDTQVKQALTVDQPQRTVSLGEDAYIGRRPGISVPPGNWNV